MKTRTIEVVTFTVCLAVCICVYFLGNRARFDTYPSAAGYIYVVDSYTGDTWLVVGEVKTPCAPLDTD